MPAADPTAPPPALSKWQAARNELARRSLSEFMRQAWPILEPGTPYIDNWHIDGVCEDLEAITRGEITRYILNEPPRYMKSTQVSICWPVWEWLQVPWERWLFISYIDKLANDHSMKRRLLVESGWYRGILRDPAHAAFGGPAWEMAGDQNAKTEFMNTRRGTMVAGTIKAPPHGKGGNRIVIDDPHNPLQAESDAEIEAATFSYRNAIVPRLNDKRRGAIVIVMQRLRDKDLAGVALAEGGWVHRKLSCPPDRPTRIVFAGGLTKDMAADEPLWPEREGKAELAKQERIMTPYRFAGQYRQEPMPPGGNIVKREWLSRRVPAPPADAVRRLRYWDKAGSSGTAGARTAGARLSVDARGRWYVEHIVKGRWEELEREAIIKATAYVDGLDTEVAWEQEPGSGGKDSALATARNLAGFLTHIDRPYTNKEARLLPLASMMAAGHVWLVDGPWVEEFIDELELFPNGLKDQVDALTGAFNLMTRWGVAEDPAVGGAALTYETADRPQLPATAHPAAVAALGYDYA